MQTAVKAAPATLTAPRNSNCLNARNTISAQSEMRNEHTARDRRRPETHVASRASCQMEVAWSESTVG